MDGLEYDELVDVIVEGKERGGGSRYLGTRARRGRVTRLNHAISRESRRSFSRRCIPPKGFHPISGHPDQDKANRPVAKALGTDLAIASFLVLVLHTLSAPNRSCKSLTISSELQVAKV